MRGRTILLFTLLLFVSGCTTGTEEARTDNPIDPGNTLDLEPPVLSEVQVGGNRVQLSWLAHEEPDVDRYVVFRRKTGGTDSEEFRVAAEVEGLSYLDEQVRDGSAYEYELAAAVGNRYGKRSPAISAVPGFFTAVLQGDAPFAASPQVQVSFGNLPGTDAVRMSESGTFTGAVWRAFSPSVSWTLSPGDGEKTVYAQFRFSDGSVSFPVSDTIVLDTRAVILSVSFTGENVRSPGESVHFRLDGGEGGGKATVEVAGLLDGLSLFDDGTGGDAAAGDGVYERDGVLPAGQSVTDATVTGRFTDAAGNQAGPVDAVRTLSVREAPEAVVLTALEPTDPPESARVLVRWTQSLDGDFGSYRIHRDTDPNVDSGDPLVGSSTDRTALELFDGDVAEGVTYYYRVFVRTRSGLEAGSNTAEILVPNLRPPATVTLRDPDGASFTRISLRWEQSGDRDFASYRIYRNRTGAPDETDDLVGTVTDVTRTFLDDTGLSENTEYFYRLYVRDSAGFVARSNEVSARTRNQDPPAVVLSQPTQVTATGATLRWSRSAIQDFEAYRVYRAAIPGVTEASVLVAEIQEQDQNEFRDENLDPDTLYYYRVFVADEGPASLTTGSNTVSARTGAAPGAER